MESLKSRWQKRLTEDSEVDVYEYAVGMALSISARADGTFSEKWKERPSNATLARRAKCSETVAKGRLRRLEDRGYLEAVERSGGRRTTGYLLTLPNRSPSTTGSPDSTGHLKRPVTTTSTGRLTTGNRSRETVQPVALGDAGHGGLLRRPLDMAGHGDQEELVAADAAEVQDGLASWLGRSHTMHPPTSHPPVAASEVPVGREATEDLRASSESISGELDSSEGVKRSPDYDAMAEEHFEAQEHNELAELRAQLDELSLDPFRDEDLVLDLLEQLAPHYPDCAEGLALLRERRRQAAVNRELAPLP